MKHLRYINESTEDKFDQDIKDILLEVQDLGYEVKIEYRCENFSIINFDNNINSFNQIGIYGKRKEDDHRHPIKHKDIKDCVLRLQDYLGDRYIGCLVFYRGRNWEIYQFTEDSYFLSPVIGILIRYK